MPSPRCIGIFYQPTGNLSPANPYRLGIERMIGAAAELGRTVTLFVPPDTDPRALPVRDCRVVHCVAPFADAATIREQFMTIQREAPMERLFGPQESTVTVTADCRAAGQISGIQPDVAQRFRNKNVMSAHAHALGITAARGIVATVMATVEVFAREVGWPIIVKPCDAAGAEGVVKLDSAAELHAAWSQLVERDPTVRVEEFIAGIEYHVDSIVRGGQVVFTRLSRYLRPLLEFRVQPPGSVIRRHDLTAGEQGILIANAALFRGFALGNGVSHNEYFVRDRDGQAVFGEASARVGGGHAVPTIEAATGVNLFAEMVRVDLDPEYRVPETRDIEVGGQLLPARVSGMIHAVTSPDQLRARGVTDVTYWYQPGDHLEAAARSTRMFGRVLATGNDFATIAGKLLAAQAHFAVQTISTTVSL